jgi:hypothetical protein
MLLVVNSDSSAAQPVRLRLAEPARPEAWNKATGEFALLPATSDVVTLDLAAGDLALLRFPRATSLVGPGPGRPDLSLAPNPARGEVRFAVRGAVGAARIEVLDATGRRWWSVRGPAGDSEWTWRGEGEGRSAPAGIYFVRVEDSRGVTSMTLAWRP